VEKPTLKHRRRAIHALNKLGASLDLGAGFLNCIRAADELPESPLRDAAKALLLKYQEDRASQDRRKIVKPVAIEELRVEKPTATDRYRAVKALNQLGANLKPNATFDACIAAADALPDSSLLAAARALILKYQEDRASRDRRKIVKLVAIEELYVEKPTLKDRYRAVKALNQLGASLNPRAGKKTCIAAADTLPDSPLLEAAKALILNYGDRRAGARRAKPVTVEELCVEKPTLKHRRRAIHALNKLGASLDLGAGFLNCIRAADELPESPLRDAAKALLLKYQEDRASQDRRKIVKPVAIEELRVEKPTAKDRYRAVKALNQLGANLKSKAALDACIAAADTLPDSPLLEAAKALILRYHEGRRANSVRVEDLLYVKRPTRRDFNRAVKALNQLGASLTRKPDSAAVEEAVAEIRSTWSQSTERDTEGRMLSAAHAVLQKFFAQETRRYELAVAETFTKEELENLPPDWEPVSSAEGDIYFWNTKTDETQWEYPKSEPKHEAEEVYSEYFDIEM